MRGDHRVGGLVLCSRGLNKSSGAVILDYGMEYGSVAVAVVQVSEW